MTFLFTIITHSRTLMTIDYYSNLSKAFDTETTTQTALTSIRYLYLY